MSDYEQKYCARQGRFTIWRWDDEDGELVCTVCERDLAPTEMES